MGLLIQYLDLSLIAVYWLLLDRLHTQQPFSNISVLLREGFEFSLFLLLQTYLLVKCIHNTFLAINQLRVDVEHHLIGRFHLKPMFRLKSIDFLYLSNPTSIHTGCCPQFSPWFTTGLLHYILETALMLPNDNHKLLQMVNNYREVVLPTSVRELLDNALKLLSFTKVYLLQLLSFHYILKIFHFKVLSTTIKGTGFLMPFLYPFRLLLVL